jgi:molecular chaperone DnaK (HSP70)
MSNDYVIGIDLGTRNSCVSIFRNGGLEIISDGYGSNVFPSVVSFYKEVKLVGNSALGVKGFNPLNTIYDVKRLIGRKFSDRSVSKSLGLFNFKIGHDDTKHENIRIILDPDTLSVGAKQVYSPEEITSFILREMRKRAKEYLKTDVTKAVISVPAYFNDAQRQATLDAAHIAGLDVIRMIHEPTAAALTYGIVNKENKKNGINLLVFDFGAGTLDVSVMNINNGTFRVLAISSNVNLGGEDFDHRIVNYIIKQFTRQHHLPHLDNIPPLSMQKLKKAAENAKKMLSISEKAAICVNSFYQEKTLSYTLTRTEFETCCSDILSMCTKYIDEALNMAQLGIQGIDTVLLVGGSTRIPRIQEDIDHYFSHSGPIIIKDINPDTIVSAGCAICGYVLTNKQDPFSSNISFLDITPLSLGVEILEKKMSVIIPRGSFIPISKSAFYSTDTDNQSEVSIKIYEGERSMTKDNFFLGQFDLSGFDSAPRGYPVIKVTFSIDFNGILQVKAWERKSDTESSISISSTWGAKGRMSQEDIEKLIAEAEFREVLDDISAKKVEMMFNISDMCHTVLINIKSRSYRLTKADKEQIKNDIIRVMNWHKTVDIDKTEIDEIKKYADHVSKKYGPLIIRTNENQKKFHSLEDSTGVKIHGDFKRDDAMIHEKVDLDINDYEKNEIKKMEKVIQDLCQNIEEVIRNPVTNLNQEDVDFMSCYIDTVQMWLFSSECYSMMEYQGKIKEINEQTAEIMNKYQSDIFQANNQISSKDELLITCHTLYQSLDSHLFTLSPETIQKLKKEVEDITDWAENHDEGDFRGKIAYLNDICNDVYSTTTTIKQDEIELPDIKIEMVPPTNKIQEDIDILIDAIDINDDELDSDEESDEEESNTELRSMLDDQKMYQQHDPQISRER